LADHPRCPDCPIAGRCVVEWSGHRTYCDWAGRGGKWLERVRELSEAGPPEIAFAPPEESANPSVQESMGLLKAMKACPYRSVFPPCGCSSSTCGLKGGKIVSYQDCMACVREFGNPG
jgi:hypothetical protein